MEDICCHRYVFISVIFHYIVMGKKDAVVDDFHVRSLRRFLKCLPAESLTVVARATGITHAHVTGMSRVMEKAGLITRETVNRRIEIGITHEGRELRNMLQAVHGRSGGLSE